MTKNLQSFFENILTWMSQFSGPNSFNQPSHPKVIDSSQSITFHSNHPHCELHLPKVDMNKFNGLDPTGLVTQMEKLFLITWNY
jgi:hypothetical protein